MTFDECFLCGRWGEMERHHLIPGMPGRQLSERYGLVVHLCHSCHQFIHSSNPAGIEQLKRLRRIGQVWAMDVQGWTIEQFIERFGKSYL